MVAALLILRRGVGGRAWMGPWTQEIKKPVFVFYVYSYINLFYVNICVYVNTCMHIFAYE
jgi:hypothetical protein